MYLHISYITYILASCIYITVELKLFIVGSYSMSNNHRTATTLQVEFPLLHNDLHLRRRHPLNVQYYCVFTIASVHYHVGATTAATTL